jgi:mediator of RNA polymerase II transcription subunit 7
VPEASWPAPPRPITSGTYSCFGDTYSTSYALPTLEEQGKAQLYPSAGDPVAELRRLVRSLAFNYVQLLDVLCNSGDTAAAQIKIADIELLFVNAHHLVNAHRPAQAREELVRLLEAQNDRKRRLLAALHAAVAEARTSLKTGIDEITRQAPSTAATATAMTPDVPMKTT